MDHLSKVSTRQLVFLLLLFLALGSFLRVYHLGTESLWLDEALSIKESAMSPMGIAEDTQQPPLYFIILNFWINLLGTSEVALRSLSAIFGIISILLIYQVGSILFDRRVGLISGLLLTISSFHIYYSQEVRCYSLLVLLSLLSYLFFIKILRGDRKWHYPCYFLATLLMGYTHIYGLLIIVSQILYFLLFWSKYRLQRVKFAITAAVTIVTLLPLVPLLGGQVIYIAEHGFWIAEPGLRSIFETLTRFAGSGPAKNLILLTFFLLLIIGFFSIKFDASKWRWRMPVESLKNITWIVRLELIEKELLLIIWLSISILMPFIVSKFMTPIYYTRYMIGASPALYLLVAKGIGNLNRKWLFYPVLIFITLLSSLGLYQYYGTYVKEQWRDVASFVGSNGKVETDVIVFYKNYMQIPFDYYYQGNIPEFGIRQNMKESEEIATFVNDAIQEKERLWLVLSHAGQTVPIRDYLMDRYGSQLVIQKEFVNVSIFLFTLSPP